MQFASTNPQQNELNKNLQVSDDTWRYLLVNQCRFVCSFDDPLGVRNDLDQVAAVDGDVAMDLQNREERLVEGVRAERRR